MDAPSFMAGELDQTWVESLRQKLRSRPTILREEAGSSSCCIHRVPTTLRQHNEKAYTPLLVSLGPFHRRNQRLQAMEEHKWRYLDKALSRANPRNGLETFLSTIKGKEQTARESYSEMIDLDSNEFVEMMVLDGCFIIEILLMESKFLTADSNDPISNQTWIIDQIKCDMILLENQVPFFILQGLFDLMTSSMEIGESLVSISFSFFHRYNHQIHRCDNNPKHLLHLIHSGVLPEDRGQNNGTAKAFPCAKQLHEAGVKFTKRDSQSFLDIRFENGVLEIPPICIADDTWSLFLNLIAFEQCYPHCESYITAYTTFLDWLMDSAEDVLILRRNKIIDNWLGSDTEVVDYINKLGRDVIVSGFYLSADVERINHYCEDCWHASRASLMQKYFHSPWAIISLSAAIILLFLTFMQTFFAVFSYSNPPS